METVKVSGPVFDGRAEAYIAEACKVAQRALGEVALSAVRSQTTAFRNPTGRFESRLDLRDYRTAAVVAAPLIYGPWLEGTGSKNKAGKFSGYRMWALAALRVVGVAYPTVEAILRPAIERSN